MKKAAALFLAFTLGRSASEAASSAADFLLIDPSPRSIATGGATAFLSEGAESLSGNPAGLAVQTTSDEVTTAYSSLAEDVRFGHAAWSRAAPGKSGWGVRFSYLRVGGIDGTDDFGQPTSDLSSGDAVLGLGWGHRLAPRLRAGLAGKLMRSEVADVASDTGLGFDAGLQYEFAEGFSVGAAVMNFGKGYKFLSQKDPLPATAGLVVGKQWGPARFMLVGRQRVNEGKFEIGAGVEGALSSVSLRAGYRQREKAKLDGQSGIGNSLRGLTSGLGIKLKNIRFDYAMDQELGDTGLAHTMAFTIAWGAPPARTAAVPPRVNRPAPSPSTAAPAMPAPPAVKPAAPRAPSVAPKKTAPTPPAKRKSTRKRISRPSK